ncbi:MAG: hypothetical protein ACT4PM_02935 [Gemmatimonadales bacterium]
MVRTTRLRLDRVASSTRNARLAPDVMVGDEIVAREGYVLAVRILDDKSIYNTVEDLSGRMVSLRAGDVLAGTLGSRRALRGYAGEVPDRLAVGDLINVLNLGGILGRCTSSNPDIGPPFRAEVLGAVLTFPELGDRVGRPASITEGAVPAADSLDCALPVIYVAGTCMNAGKTVAATELVRGLTRSGLRVAACKLTGVSLMRDTLSMQDAGAVAALTFTDAGIASTHPGSTVPVARGLLNRLARTAGGGIGHHPDVIVAELGDGILGEYGVQDILEDGGLMRLAASHLMAAPDPVACWGAHQLYTARFHLPITCFTGPSTDNQVGRHYITGSLGLPAHNALRDAAGLVETVARMLDGWAAGRLSGSAAGGALGRPPSGSDQPSSRLAVQPPR